MAPAVESIAVAAMSVNPKSPSDGRAASAIAVGPYCTTWPTVSVPNTASAIRMYVSPVMPRAPDIARGRSCEGLRRSPAVKVITLKPR